MNFRDVNRNLHLYCTDFTKVADIKRLTAYDGTAVRAIAELERAIEQVKEYRKELYEHVQELEAQPYELALALTRRKFSDGVQFYLHLEKHYQNGLTSNVLNEHYTGKERSKAIARYEELKKQHNGIKAIKEIEKARWER